MLIPSCGWRLAAGGTTTELPVVPVEGGEFGYALNEFAAAIAAAREPEVGLAEHIRSLAIAFAIIESGRTGQRAKCAP